MFTLQVQELEAALIQMGMPVEMANQFSQTFGNCAQALQHNGPVAFNGPVKLNGPTTIDGPLTLGPAAATTVLNTINNYTNTTNNNTTIQVLVNSGGGIEWLNLTKVTVLVAWRYYSSTHNFEIQTQTFYVVDPGQISAWTTNPNGNQPQNVSHVTNVSYATHALTQTKTQANCYVLEGGTTGDSNVFTAVNVGNVVNDVEWNTDTANALTEDFTAAVYALEAGSVTTGQVIDTAVTC